MPLTMQVAARSSGEPGRTVGTIYAVNTVGSILGSFLGGLVILPLARNSRHAALDGDVLRASRASSCFVMSQESQMPRRTQAAQGEFDLPVRDCHAARRRTSSPCRRRSFVRSGIPLTMSSGMVSPPRPKSRQSRQKPASGWKALSLRRLQHKDKDSDVLQRRCDRDRCRDQIQRIFGRPARRDGRVAANSNESKYFTG